MMTTAELHNEIAWYHKLKLRDRVIALFIIGTIILILGSRGAQIKAEGIECYSISTKSKPFYKSYLKYPTYNSDTKDYYLIRSYLRRLEKCGGGVLVIKKGTYTISGVLHVPSNVNILLINGVVIKKGTMTGNPNMSPSKSIFQLVSSSRAKKAESVGYYNGEQNIKIMGEGNATIDLCNMEGSLAIIAGHNRNITIENINFVNGNAGHFLEIDAVDGMVIKDCSFKNAIASKQLIKEAINIDTPDYETKGFNNSWSTHDKTPNNNILIDHNYFYNLDRAIGTHKYSQDMDDTGSYTINKYHTNIIIKNNTIDSMRSNGIGIMNWKDCVIQNNKIANITRGKYSYSGIIGSGIDNISIEYNTFDNMEKPVIIYPTKNTGSGALYSIIYNNITDDNKTKLSYNFVTNVNKTYAIINNLYKVYSNPEKIKMILR